MKMVERKVETFISAPECSNCKAGLMIFDKSTLRSVDYSIDVKTPVVYQHVCSKCGHKENYDETYPHTSYRYND